MRRVLLLVVGLLALVSVAVASSGGASEAQTRRVVTDLGTLGGGNSDAIDLNSRGQVVGWADTRVKNRDGDRISHAFLWQSGRMHDLGSLAHRKQSDAAAVNDRGEVVGSSGTTGRNWLGDPAEHAFLWRNGRMLDLGTLGGPESSASDVNDHGQVVGSADLKSSGGGSPPFHAFLWENGKMRDLGTLGGRRSAAVDINDRGQVVGWSTVTRRYANGEPMVHAFLWKKGKMRDLGALPGGKESMAVAINNAGQVAAYSYYTEFMLDTTPGHNVNHATGFLWQEGRRTPLGMKESFPRAINDNGEVIGEIYPYGKQWMDGPGSGGEARAFSWQDGKQRILRQWEPTQNGPYGFSWAEALNDSGQVVGLQAKAGMRACVWGPGGTLVALPSVRDYVGSDAVAINNRGQIVGWSETKSGDEHAVLWTLKRG